MVMATKTSGGSTTRRTTKWSSRAVLRMIEPGSTVECEHCGGRVKFQARVRLMQVICNVYADGVWQRVEHFHAECYEAAGSPYGEPIA
jgi:DNA-directed RNA polymerase subunit RPC12/RpoP